MPLGDMFCRLPARLSVPERDYKLKHRGWPGVLIRGSSGASGASFVSPLLVGEGAGPPGQRSWEPHSGTVGSARSALDPPLASRGPDHVSFPQKSLLPPLLDCPFPSAALCFSGRPEVDTRVTLLALLQALTCRGCLSGAVPGAGVPNLGPTSGPPGALNRFLGPALFRSRASAGGPGVPGLRSETPPVSEQANGLLVSGNMSRPRVELVESVGSERAAAGRGQTQDLHPGCTAHTSARCPLGCPIHPLPLPWARMWLLPVGLGLWGRVPSAVTPLPRPGHTFLGPSEVVGDC